MTFRKIETNATPRDIDSVPVFRYTGVTGDIGYVDAGGFGREKTGTFFQSTKPANLFFTLDSPSEAASQDPSIQAGVTWDGPYVCNTLITNFNKPFTTFKIVFTTEETIVSVATVRN